MEEQIALDVINRNRMIKATAAFFHVVGPENFDRLFRQYKGLIFPEEKYDEIKYIQKARRIFEKLKNVDFRIKPIKMRGRK